MNRKVLVLTNSNVFTVLTSLFIRHEYDYSVLNVRYTNETLDQDEHFVQQLKEMRLDYYYKKGRVRSSKYEYAFTERLIYRLEKAMNKYQPGMIFYEMKTTNDSEWVMLAHLQDTFAEVPIAVFLNLKDNQDKVISYLSKIGIKEVITKFDKKIFLSVVKRNLQTQT